MPAALVPNYRIAFFSVPKSASTSTKLVLYRLKHGKEWHGLPDKVHPMFPTFPIKSGETDVPPNYWTFTIIRDPIQRLLSSYGNRVLHHRDIERDLQKRQTQDDTFSNLNPIPEPNEFFEKLLLYQKASYSIWHHTISVKNFIGDDLNIFDDIYTISEISKFEADISAYTKQSIKMPREQTGGPKIAFSDLGAQAQEVVLKTTDADYTFLSKYFSAPNLR